MPTMGKRRRRTLVVSLAVACSLPAGCRGEPRDLAPEPAAPLTVAILRTDGYLVPFARWESGAWTGPATVAGGGTLEPDGAPREAPWFEAQLDDLRQWTVLTPLDSSAMREPAPASTPGAPVDVRTYCQAAWMLESDLPATPVPESQMAAAVAGVGFSGEVDVVPAVVLAPDDAEHARALAAIQASFDAAEAAESDRRAAAGSYEARTVGAELATVHLAVTSLHRVGAGGDRSLYAFEARRTYAAQQGSFPDECDQVTIMTGWLAGNVSDALTVIPGASAVELTNCDRKGVAVVEPLGAAVVDGRTFVVVVNHGYEGESYSIQDVSPAEVRETIIVHGGGC